MKRPLHWVAQSTGSDLFFPSGVEPAEQQVDLALVETDSRRCTKGSTYVARVGEQMDGHVFAAGAVEAGCSALIVERPLPDVAVPQVVVQDSTVALGELAKAHLADLRDRTDIQVIGITGSAGKTTTKDLLGSVLADHGPTVRPILSFNNEVGCPLTVLEANEETRYLVLEMGASGKDELRYLTDIAPLDVAVVLLVGRAHLGGFGDVETLAKAKRELVEGLALGGVAVLNLDDEDVWAMRSKAPGKVISFSAQGNKQADLRAISVRVDSFGHAHFTLEAPACVTEVGLSLVGLHQVSNALAVLATANALGLDVCDVASRIGGFAADSPHRMAMNELTVQRGSESVEVVLLDDSYNANPDSVKAAFDTAAPLAKDRNCHRIILVLGEMLELGEASAEIHREVASYSEVLNPSLVVLVGEGAGSYAAGLDEDTDVRRTANHEEAYDVLTTNLEERDFVLVKGSNGSGVWQIADMMVKYASPTVALTGNGSTQKDGK